MIQDLQSRNVDSCRVVIVGAGVSGLTAAYQLRRAGHEVVVLEGRTRPGGRVMSVRGDFADGLHAEAGALFLPLEHDYLMKYVGLTGLRQELVPLLPSELRSFSYLDGERYLDDGTRPLQWRHDGRLEEADWPGGLSEAEMSKTLGRLDEMYLDHIDGGLGNFLAADWPPGHLRGIDGMTAVEFLQSLGASKGAAELIRLSHVGMYGENNGRDMSATFFLQQWMDTRSLGTAGTWTTLTGGNDRWIRRLAEMMKEIVDYGTTVVAARQDAGSVRVVTSARGRQATIEADYLIFALPFACLREIEIESGLGADKQNVIENLRSTPVSHLFIQCKKRVWRRPDGRGLFALSHADFDLAAAVRDTTFNQPGPRAILDVFMAGQQAERMDALDPDERFTYALKELSALFPEIYDVAEGAVHHSWSTDPFSRGAYVSYKAGQFEELWPGVSTPEGRFFFAGDQTSVKSAWQDGAIESAHRAAREVFVAAETVG